MNGGAKRPRFPAAVASAVGRPPQQRTTTGAVRGDPAPSGLGLDSPRVRARMVQRLRAGGVADVRVLDALTAVPRHHFVDGALVNQAYEDTSLPIGHGQTISKPSVIARMLELLLDGAQGRALGHLGRALEIGSGCGYQAALLARVARSVISIERVKPLHELARERLAPLRAQRGVGDIRLVYGDGRLGHAPNAPYDSIVSAAGGDEVPPAWLEQLAIGGRLVAPLHDGGGGVQRLVVIDRDERGMHRRVHEAVRFVALKSGVA